MKTIFRNLLLILFVFCMNNVTAQVNTVKKEMSRSFFSTRDLLIRGMLGRNLKKIREANTLNELEDIGFEDVLDRIFVMLCNETGFVWRFEENHDKEEVRFFEYVFRNYNKEGMSHKLFENVYNAWYEFHVKKDSLIVDEGNEGSDIGRVSSGFYKHLYKKLSHFLGDL